MAIEPQIFFGRVMHTRLFPKVNKFTYGMYYLSLPLSKMSVLPLAHNRFAPLSFYDRDHGACDGTNLKDWACKILLNYDLRIDDGDIKLICMPRVLGYVFNPVSFYMCYDKDSQLRAVLCEVHNTFGERHTYICAHENNGVIAHDDIIKAQKIFHVSPFLKREGHYTFRFDTRHKKFRAWIDYYDGDANKKLVTSLIGNFMPMNKKTLRRAFWGYPLITFKAIVLIHWQALKLTVKGIKYIPKPKQKDIRESGASINKK